MTTRFFIFYMLVYFFISTGLYGQGRDKLPFGEPPEWSKKAIWYQIFIERFRNGNPGNDPTPTTCYNALTEPFPADWALTPWGHNWYKQESWARTTGLDFYRTIQMRRYGGDLDGVIEKIPYLKELGINAIYFNPLNDAPSLHKYDARYYHHIDVTLGDNPEEDMKSIETEDPENPETWVLTSADKKFIELVRLLHAEGIRVVLDFSWNHTGKNFWAFKDIEKKGRQSKYADWYQGHFVKDKNTGREKFEYEGWLGISSLPEWKEINSVGKKPGHPFEGQLHPEVAKHIFAVSKRWMDPDRDGNFDDGIDGMRLDVAEHVPLGFWREFRQYVRAVNPDFYLVGENWWTKWPDELMDPAPWVKGDVFDAVMHYQWYKVARGYFAQPEDNVSLAGFMSGMDSVFLKYPVYTRLAMMNLSASHDAPRLLTCFGNPIKYKFSALPRDNASYDTRYPDQEVYDRVKLFLLHQYTFVGSPHIWNGDEMGMTGADDPDCRKPLAWDDITFENETQAPMSADSYDQKIEFNHDLFEYYKSLIQLRKSSETFVYGDYRFVKDYLADNVLAYTRNLGNETFLMLFNVNPNANSLKLPGEWSTSDMVFSYGETRMPDQNRLFLPAFSAVVLRKSR